MLSLVRFPICADLNIQDVMMYLKEKNPSKIVYIWLL